MFYFYLFIIVVIKKICCSIGCVEVVLVRSKHTKLISSHFKNSCSTTQFLKQKQFNILFPSEKLILDYLSGKENMDANLRCVGGVCWLFSGLFKRNIWTAFIYIIIVIIILIMIELLYSYKSCTDGDVCLLIR